MVKLLYIDKDYAERIEKAGKTSTAKEPCDPEGFTRRIVKAQHLSLGRFANATFEVECSRACGNQLERHPHLNFCQESQRYVEMPKLNSKMAPSEIAKYCVIPPSVKIDKILFYEYLAALFESYRIYHHLIKLGVAREDARYILPLACKTRITVSGNFQAWLDFCSLRTQNETQWELREIAQRIFNILCQEAPAFFEYFRDNGKCARKKFVKEGE